MKKQFLFVLLGLVVLLVAAGQLARAAAGPDPHRDIQDSVPFWTSDGARLYAERTSPNFQHAVTLKPGGKDFYVAWYTGVLRGTVADSSYILVQVDTTSTIMTTGGRFAGPNAILHGTDASPSPDGMRVAYVRGGTLYVARIDNLPTPGAVPPSPAVETAVATGISPSDAVGPAWSPDGSRIVVASGGTLFLVQSDGTGSRVLTTGGNPSWAADGSTIAFERNAQVWLVQADGTGERDLANGRFPQFSPSAPTVAYISDRRHAKGGATQYQYALYVQPISSVARKLVDDVHPESPPRWSRAGDLIAVSAGQECRRWGIYVVPSGGGSAHRRSNLCRYDGTTRADTIHASPYFDIINGLGGNDHLYGFWGSDKILGENGDDTLVGDSGNDVLFGGPGDDAISGGTGNDTIIGGPGADRIDCGPGVDTVEGAGRLDRIARDCERVTH